MTTYAETNRAAALLSDAEREVLAGVPMLQLLSPDVRSLVSELFVPVELTFGDLLFEAGDPADGYYLVVEGHVRIVIDGPNGEISAALMSPGDGFGERSMLEDAVRTAAARASSSTVRLLFLHRAVFDALVRLHPSLADALARQAHAQRLMDLLRTQHAFGQLPRDALAELVIGLESVRLGPGDVVIREGDEPDAAYLVEAGRLAATTTREEAPVGYFRTGDTVGELALVTGAVRTATVSAVDEATVVRIDRERFRRLLDEHPAFRAAIEDRIAGTTRRRNRSPSTSRTGSHRSSPNVRCRPDNPWCSTRNCSAPSTSTRSSARPSSGWPSPASSRTSARSTRWTAAPHASECSPDSTVVPCLSHTSARPQGRARRAPASRG